MDPTLPMLRLPYDKKSFPSFTYSRRTIFWRNVAQYETRELRRNRILPWAVVHNQNEPHKKKKKDHHSLRCRNRFVSLTSWLFDSDPIWLIRIPPGCSSTRKLHQKPTCGPWPITRGFFLFFFFSFIFFHLFLCVRSSIPLSLVGPHFTWNLKSFQFDSPEEYKINISCPFSVFLIASWLAGVCYSLVMRNKGMFFFENRQNRLRVVVIEWLSRGMFVFVTFFSSDLMAHERMILFSHWCRLILVFPCDDLRACDRQSPAWHNVSICFHVLVK